MFGSILALGFTNPQAIVFYKLFGHHEMGLRNRAFHVCRELKPTDQYAYILDAGCGDGAFSFFLAQRYPGAQITAVDIDYDLLANCEQVRQKARLSNISFVHGDLQLFVCENRFDLIVCVDALEHIQDDRVTLHNLYVSCQQNGRLLLHVPKRHHLQRGLFRRWLPSSLSKHVRDEYLESEIVSQIEEAGFTIDKVVYTSGFLGESVWALGKILQVHSTMAFTLLFPLLLLLCWIDSLLVKLEGSGFLVKARKA